MRLLDEKLERFIAGCREAGLKATHQRIEIYRELANTAEHPDAETIYSSVKKRMPSISFDTVYRTLRTLEEKGLVARVGSPLDRYRFDADVGLHHHFICSRCGAVRDLDADEFDACSAIPDSVRRFGVPESVHVEVRGLCNTCSGKDEE